MSWSLAEKAALLRRSYQLGMNVSLIACQEGVSASLLSQWRKCERKGALTAVSAGEAMVPASDLAAAQAKIAKVQRVLGKKTLENESSRKPWSIVGRVRATTSPTAQKCLEKPGRIKAVNIKPHQINSTELRADG